jgi:hypothetical protein
MRLDYKERMTWKLLQKNKVPASMRHFRQPTMAQYLGSQPWPMAIEEASRCQELRSTRALANVG